MPCPPSMALAYPASQRCVGSLTGAPERWRSGGLTCRGESTRALMSFRRSSSWGPSEAARPRCSAPWRRIRRWSGHVDGTRCTTSTWRTHGETSGTARTSPRRSPWFARLDDKHRFAIDDVSLMEALHVHGRLGAKAATGTLEFNVPAFTNSEDLQLCSSGERLWTASKDASPSPSPS